MDSIDHMTLSFLMNKNTYNRYIAKTDPDKYKEQEEYRDKIRKYKNTILSITTRFLENPDLQITNEMNDMFSDYCKTCIKYFELKDLENSCSYEKEDKDDEMLFDPEQMTEYGENEKNDEITEYDNIEKGTTISDTDQVNNSFYIPKLSTHISNNNSNSKCRLDAFFKQKR